MSRYIGRGIFRNIRAADLYNLADIYRNVVARVLAAGKFYTVPAKTVYTVHSRSTLGRKPSRYGTVSKNRLFT